MCFRLLVTGRDIRRVREGTSILITKKGFAIHYLPSAENNKISIKMEARKPRKDFSLIVLAQITREGKPAKETAVPSKPGHPTDSEQLRPKVPVTGTK